MNISSFQCYPKNATDFFVEVFVLNQGVKEFYSFYSSYSFYSLFEPKDDFCGCISHEQIQISIQNGYKTCTIPTIWNIVNKAS